jgi:hypothetical protein
MTKLIPHPEDGGNMFLLTREKREMRTLFWLDNLKNSLVRRGHTWEDNIKMNLKEIGWEVCTAFI